MSFEIEQIAWAGREVERQKASPTFVTGFLMGVDYMDGIPRDEFTRTDLFDMSQLVMLGRIKYGFRRTPVTFSNGGSSASYHVIPDGIETLEVALTYMEDQEVDAWIKQFLWIHPFEDGNGRVASILRNWLLGTLKNPTDLPDYGW